MDRYNSKYLNSLHGQDSAGQGGADNDEAEAMVSDDPSNLVRNVLRQVSNQDHDCNPCRQVYTQLDCLETVRKEGKPGEAKAWKEKYRWIKYEEEIEAVGNRWSKPHVPILSPFSLLEARRQLDAGIVHLQPVSVDAAESQSLEQVIEFLINEMRELGMNEESMSEVRSLLAEPHLRFTDKVSNLLTAEQDTAQSPKKFNKKYRKKVEKSAEACEIMCGTSNLLKETFSAFIRLSQPIKDPILEIDIPIRFLCVIIAPKMDTGTNVVNIGRSVAAMMVDQIFRNMAYVVTTEEAMLAAVDEFLKSASIIPPAGCSRTDRMPPPSNPPDMRYRQGDDNSYEFEVVSHGEIPGLERTGRLFGGLINDVKRRLPHYKSDFTDALHLQTFGSFFFIYFACITPIITFGGLLSDATKGYLGAIESIMSGVICGVSFALFSGQPLTILGSTGPVLVFETIVFNNCERYGFDYLPMRWWIGMWTAFFLFLIVATDLSFLVKYITRFTEESFALLIAVIFIYEAFAKLMKISVYYPVNFHWTPKYNVVMDCSCITDENVTRIPIPKSKALFLPTMQDGNHTYANFSAFDYYSFDWKLYKDNCELWGGMWVGEGCDQKFTVPDVFFFSCLLFIFTYIISSQLKQIKMADIFPAFVRGIISDFAVMIAVCSMTALDFATGLHTPKLLIPTKFEPTLGFEVRGWIVPPFGRNPWYSALIAIGPAILAVILLFLDQHITAVIVNRKENKMKKGVGYHLDLLVVAACVAVNSALGIPWFVAATVLSINHVLSLKKETECTAPGERPTFLGCRENRVTGLLVFSCIGMSVFMTSILQYIPMPVLYGVFLFMGTSSLNGLQLYQRLFLFIQPNKYQPDLPFLRHVKLLRVHLFTAIQILCFALLWTIKKISFTSILFPLMVLSMCFIRKLLDFLFDRDELRLLDDLFPEQAKKESLKVRRASRMSATAVEMKETKKEGTKQEEETALFKDA